MTGFDVIPVIDLKDGMVVHAREGRREEYNPIRSRLIPGAEPSGIVEALLAVHSFKRLYIADLDAIQRHGDNMESIRTIQRNFPDLELWADTGIGDVTALYRWLDTEIGGPVIGSESLSDAGFLSVVRDHCKNPGPVLSLDYQGNEFKGPSDLLEHPERYWPPRVLAMNLQRVGSDKGPDLALIVELARRVPGCEVYAAGGVRSIGDLESIAAAGAAGALIASALHDRRIGSSELARFENLSAQRKK